MKADRARAAAAALKASGVSHVAADPTTRAAYSSDASLYRVQPLVVAFPRDADEVGAAVAASIAAGLPVVARGGGTSVAGNAIGDGVILDLSRHFNRVLSIDPESKSAVVQPGVVQAKLQSAAAPFGLRFGPDPSTSSRCTIGGMIGNNACGSRSLAYGRTSDNVNSVRLLTSSGDELSTDSVGKKAAAGELSALTALRELVQGDLATIRTEFGRFPRQVSGYALESLLPENGFGIARLMVGSEGTLGIVTEATVRLVRQPEHRVMVVLGFPDLVAAAEAVPEVLTFRPTACEGLDSRIIDAVRASKGSQAVPDLPAGGGWLLVELARGSLGECRAAAHELVARVRRPDAIVVEDSR
jgi:FAD/FMN-containing dehydrogenase